MTGTGVFPRHPSQARAKIYAAARGWLVALAAACLGLAAPPAAAAPGAAQVFVRPLADAPADWRLGERVARALSAHGFAARLDGDARDGYVVAGHARLPEVPGGDLLVDWEIFDPEGALLRRFTQLTAAPAADRALEAFAEAAAGGVALALPAPAQPAAGAVASASGAFSADGRGAVAPPPPGGARWAQIGAFADREQAERWYGEVRARRADLLAGLPHVVQPVDLGASRGVWYRVRVGPFGDEAAADRLCRALLAGAIDCFVPEAG